MSMATWIDHEVVGVIFLGIPWKNSIIVYNDIYFILGNGIAL